MTLKSSEEIVETKRWGEVGSEFLNFKVLPNKYLIYGFTESAIKNMDPSRSLFWYVARLLLIKVNFNSK